MRIKLTWVSTFAPSNWNGNYGTHPRDWSREHGLGWFPTFSTLAAALVIITFAALTAVLTLSTLAAAAALSALVLVTQRPPIRVKSSVGTDKGDTNQETTEPNIFHGYAWERYRWRGYITIVWIKKSQYCRCRRCLCSWPLLDNQSHLRLTPVKEKWTQQQ